MLNPFKLQISSDDSLKPNDSQKGLEKVVGSINTYIIRAADAMGKFFYGAYVKQNDSKASKIEKSIDRGLINILTEISNIDLCNLFNYLANNKLGKGFDPKNIPLSTDPTIKKIKYGVQINAFKLQSLIDNYFAGGINLIELVRSVNISLSSLTKVDLGLNNPELRKEFPEVDLISNFLNDKLGQLTSLLEQSANGVIPVNKVQEVIDTVNKIRFYCVAIQTLNNPAAIISAFPNSVQKDLDKLNKIVDPNKFTPFIYRLLKTCNKINTTCRSILAYISRAQLIVKFAILVIRAIKAIKAFFLVLPLVPVPSGAQTSFSVIYQQKLTEQGDGKLLKVLKQIKDLLDRIYFLVSGIIVAITEVIRLLNVILLNIKSCNQELVDPIQNAIKELESTKKDLQKFIDSVNEARKRIDNTFGGYTIEIVSEELADEGISIRRRFGIARGINGVIAVESTPTFASLDQIIINEVKLLLVSKGLVKPGGFSPEEDQLIKDVSVYAENSDILDSIQSVQTLDITSEEGGDSDLNKFINNLPGGKAFKKKTREKLLKNVEKLKDDLRNIDPNKRYGA